MTSIENPAPRKRWSCCVLSLIGMAIPAFAVVLLVGWMILIHRVLPAPPLVISEETTRITGPLTAEGYVDYFKALEERTYPPELATDENGFRVFVRLFGDVARYDEPEDREFYRLQRYEKLGLDPDVPPTLVFPNEVDYVLQNYYKGTDEEHSWTSLLVGSRPWTLEDYPMLADWVNEIDEPLDAIAEAIRKPVFWFPLLQSRVSAEAGTSQNLIAMMLPELQLSRRIARIFHARATYRVGQGNIDGAIDDKLTILRLGRQKTHGGPLVQYLHGIAIEGMAYAIPIEANPEYPLTEQQIRRLLDGLDALPPLAPFSASIEWERYWALSFVQSSKIAIANGNMSLSKGFEMLSNPGHHHHANWLALGASPRSFDWNVIYRRVNEVYDAAQKPSPRTEYAAILNEIEEVNPWQILSHLLTPGGKNTLLGFRPKVLYHKSPLCDLRVSFVSFVVKKANHKEYNGFTKYTKSEKVWVLFLWAEALANQIIALLAPAADAFEAAIHRAECAENMQRLALAILLYELEHGTMPGENWAEQIAEYLGENPERYFSCPANPSPRGSTTYALIQYGDAVADSLMLIELPEAVPLNEAVITVDEVIVLADGGRVVEIVEGECCGRTYTYERITGTASRLNAHPGGANTAHRNGAVRFMSQTIAKEELLRLLGREENNEGE